MPGVVESSAEIDQSVGRDLYYMYGFYRRPWMLMNMQRFLMCCCAFLIWVLVMVVLLAQNAAQPELRVRMPSVLNCLVATLPSVAQLSMHWHIRVVSVDFMWAKYVIPSAMMLCVSGCVSVCACVCVCMHEYVCVCTCFWYVLHSLCNFTFMSNVKCSSNALYQCT